MIPLYIRIREDQNQFLRRLKGSLVENIRKALDEYIEKIKSQNIATSASKGGK